MAKIPILFEPGRADGKLANSNAIFDENKGMFQSEINDIQDTLNSDNPNKPLSAKQGKVLKELLDTKVIEAGGVPIDTEPTEGNTANVVTSDGIYKALAKKVNNITFEEKVAELDYDIEFLNANTGISEYPTFDETKAHAVGDVVLYEGLMYRFTSEHAAGVWDASQVEVWSERKRANEELTKFGFEAKAFASPLIEVNAAINNPINNNLYNAVKEVSLFGDWDTSKYYTIRVIQRNTATSLRVGIVEYGKYNDYDYDSGNVELTNVTLPYTSVILPYNNGKSVVITLDMNVVTDGLQINISENAGQKYAIDKTNVVVERVKVEDLDALSYRTTPFLRIRNSSIIDKYKLLIKAFKTIRLVGDWDSNKKYYIRVLSRSGNVFRIVIAEVGYPSIYIYDSGSVTFSDTTNPYTYISFPTKNGRSVECAINVGAITDEYSFVTTEENPPITINPNCIINIEKADIDFLSKEVNGIQSEVDIIEGIIYDNVIEDKEQDVVSIIPSMMIKRPSSVTDYLPLSTSSGGRLFYYKIDSGSKYRIKVVNRTPSHAYWGYANVITDKLNVTYPDVEQVEGKCVDLSVPDGTEYEVVIDSAENYNYIVVCTTESNSNIKLYAIYEYSVPINEKVSIIEQRINESKDSLPYDIATGTMDESCLADNEEDYFVGYSSVIGGVKAISDNEHIVAVGHDDLTLNDLIATRRIYNKYGFTTGFNYILNPFTNKKDKELRIENTKKMIADGHEIGFHAIFGTSFFWRNPMYDVTPNSSATFAPLLNDMRTNVGSGKNVFGKNITSATTFSDYGYSGNTSTSNITINIASEAQWFDAHKYYTIYGTTRTSQGLDLEDNVVTKTILQWLEYWYNELIDDSLGYSKYDGTIAERFAEDYEGDYPSAEMITSGNLSSSGRFIKGLFKDCHSCCNYEVVDRIIRVAEAFTRKFYGLSKFTNMAYHGSVFIELYWADDNSTLYNDRNKTILATGHTKLFISAKNKYMNLFEIALSHGIKINKRNYPDDPTRVEGQIGLFKGQESIRGAYFNDLSTYHINNYLSLLATSSTSTGMEEIDYNTFMSYAPKNVDDWFKWAYENAGADISGNGTMFILKQFNRTINTINKAIGTGKIPFIGVDTIKKSASISAAVEMLCQYCYRHNIRIVSPTQAMEIANKNRVLGNMFPNPTFKRSILEDCGGESAINSAYIPDGWYSATDIKPNVYKDNNDKVLSITSGTLQSRIYGLPSGKYRFTAMAKSDNSNNDTTIYFAKKLNGAKVADNNDVVNPQWLVVGNGEYAEVTYEFVIEEPHRNEVDGTLANNLCNGYEDNVNHVVIKLIAASGDTLAIKKPRIENIN